MGVKRVPPKRKGTLQKFSITLLLECGAAEMLLRILLIMRQSLAPARGLAPHGIISRLRFRGAAAGLATNLLS
jgi:hypothetical protein